MDTQRVYIFMENDNSNSNNSKVLYKALVSMGSKAPNNCIVIKTAKHIKYITCYDRITD